MVIHQIKLTAQDQAEQIHAHNTELVRYYKEKHNIPFDYYPAVQVEDTPIPAWAEEMMRNEWSKLTEIPF